MPTLLARHARVLVTLDDQRREIPDGALFVRGNRIEVVGPSAELPDRADEVIDLSGHVVLPGLINTHHHLYQTLTRAVPAAQDAELFDWLREHRDRLWECAWRVAWIVENEPARQRVERWLTLAGDRLFRGEVTPFASVRAAVSWLVTGPSALS